MAPSGPPAAAPTARPVKAPMFSCLDAACRPAAGSDGVAAAAGKAASDSAATVMPTVPTRTLLLRMLICWPSRCDVALRAVEHQYKGARRAGDDVNRAVR